MVFHALSPEYALYRAHTRDNFLRDANVSQFGLLVFNLNLAALFCTLSNALTCPSLYGSQHAAPYFWMNEQMFRNLKHVQLLLLYVRI